MAGVAKVVLEDGTTEEIKIKPGLMVQVERHFKGDVPPIEGVLYACWLKLARGQIPFEQWIDTVESIDQADDGESGPLDEEASPAA